MSEAHETVVVANARRELLRSLEAAEAMTERMQREEGGDYWPTHFPLFVGEWANSHADIMLAAREAAALGDIEFNDQGRHPNGPMVRITEQGRKVIAAMLVLGEAEQERGRSA